MKNNITKTQIVTIILLILYARWEYYVAIWSKTEPGPVIRVDLGVIYPVLVVLIIISIRQVLKTKK